jgi:hypothetical protein
MSLFMPQPFAVKYVAFKTAKDVSLTATASPGTTIVSSPVTVNPGMYYVIVAVSVWLYNPGTSTVNETIQVFADSTYTDVGVITVPAGGYAHAMVNYVFSLGRGQHTIGIAGYGGSLTASAEMTVLATGYQWSN